MFAGRVMRAGPARIRAGHAAGRRGAGRDGVGARAGRGPGRGGAPGLHGARQQGGQR